jgi:hypothetical protein
VGPRSRRRGRWRGQGYLDIGFTLGLLVFLNGRLLLCLWDGMGWDEVPWAYLCGIRLNPGGITDYGGVIEV